VNAEEAEDIAVFPALSNKSRVVALCHGVDGENIIRDSQILASATQFNLSFQ
jgi:hypothetical protein